MPSFAHPLWLLLAPPLFFFLWKIQRTSFAEAAAPIRGLWFLIRSTVLLLLILALAGFQWKTSVRQKQVIFLIDSSDSISPEQHEQALAWMNETLRSLHPPDQAGIVTFGSNAAVERFPSAPRPTERIESKLDGAATNFEEAATLADALFAESYQKNIVLISDGHETAGAGKERFEELRRKGVSTQALYLPPADHPEAGVESARVPEFIGLKQNFDLDIVLSGNRNGPALLQVYRNGALLQEGTVGLEKGRKESLQLAQKIEEPGLYRYQVVLKPSADFRVENNSREVWVQVAGPPRILLADEAPGDLRPLAAALQNRGFQVESRSPQNFPLTLPDMLLYQAIFVRNIPASRIHDQMPLLRAYVRDFGGGFAMLGGKQSFGPGGYYKTPVEEILPVTMDLQNKKYLADVAIVIVIDKSGSMSYTDRGKQKIDLADEGGARVAALLKMTDQLGVLAVDSVPKWAFPLQKLANRQSAVDAITSIRAGGGGIYVYSGIQAAYEELRGSKASVKHIILFADTSDCEEKEGPGGESSLALARRALEQDNITTTSIGIGQKGDSDVGFLEDLATIGKGRFYFTNDMFTLPEIFTQESAIVQRYYINEERFTPSVVDPEPVLFGITSTPDLLAYVATSPKPAAVRALVSHRDDPVLAYWRHGLGQTLAFTSSPTSDWAAPWMAWPDFERFWAQAARYTARAGGPSRFDTSFAYDGHNTTIVVEAQNEQGGFLNGAQFQAVFLDAAGSTRTLAMSQASPGRYEAAVPGAGSLFGKVFRLENGSVAEEAVVQTPGYGGSEYEERANGRDALKEIAEKVVESPSALKFSNKTSEDVQPLQHRLLWLAALLFLLDVAARKISFRDLKLPERKPVAATTLGSPSLGRLKERKKSVEQAYSPKEMPVVLPDTLPPVPPSEPATPPVSVQPQESTEYLSRLKEAKRRKK